jgi:hypothetical protein
MKFKNILIYSLTALLAFSSTGCEEDFLETGPSTAISDELLFKTVSGAQNAMNGVYNYMRLRNQDIEFGTIIQYNNGFDIMGQDLIVRNSMGQMQVYYAHNTNPTRADGAMSLQIWTYFYTIINNVNIILDNIDRAEGNAAQKSAIKGQAMAIRGWAYFYLVRFYQQSYNVAKDMPGVPYYDKGATTEGKPREKVSVIYANVVNDLKAAIDLLGPYSRAYKSQINQPVAQGILAEVYLTMEDWANAAAMAKAAKTNFPLMSGTAFQAGFNDWTNGEWMWGVSQSSTQNLGNGSPFTLWANQTRGTRWTFDFLYVNDKFKDLFEKDDVRNQFWFRTDHGHWTSNKFREAQDDFYGDVVLMRSAQMYLTEAESLARQGKDVEAKEVLWMLQDIRKATRSVSTGNALIEEILLERRKELYSEGVAWFDLIRTGKPVKRTGDHPAVVEIPARSWRFILQLPVNEFNSNTSLGSADQNPYDGIYQP